MADDDRLKILEDRLTRIEAALTQRPPVGGGGVTPPGGGVVVDPAPHPYATAAQFRRPIPSPVVDSSPWWGGGYGRPRWPWPPSPVVDPAPWPPQYITDPAPWPPNFISDPAPSPFTNAAVHPSAATMAFSRMGPIGDPAPFDYSTLSLGQLESSLHSVNAERARLDSLEATLKQQLERAKQKASQR